VATSLGLEARVEFVGEVPDVALRDYYATADVFVLPATVRAEAFGTVLLEAMAMGLPVVSTELGTGTSWVNQDGITGHVVPANSPTALATAIQKLLADAACRQLMGKAAREWVEAEFSMTAMLQRVEAVYEQALSRALATPPPSL
jgi:glycosyltransferase involved in cell wall biosynthesis